MKKLSRLNTLLELISEKVDLAELIEKIPFDGSELIEAALEQPVLHKEAAKLRVQCMHRVKALESKLALKQSEIGQRYRRIRDPQGKKTNTEGAVKAYIEQQPIIQKLRAKLNLAIVKEEMAKQLLDVYKSRKDVIRIIIDSGKISLQAKEIALLKGNEKLRSVVRHLSNRHNIHEI